MIATRGLSSCLCYLIRDCIFHDPFPKLIMLDYLQLFLITLVNSAYIG